MGTAVKHSVPDRVKPSFVILTSRHSDAQSGNSGYQRGNTNHCSGYSPGLASAQSASTPTSFQPTPVRLRSSASSPANSETVETVARTPVYTAPNNHMYNLLDHNCDTHWAIT